MGSTGAVRFSAGNIPPTAERIPDATTSSLSEIQTYIAENYDIVEVEVLDKWGDYLQTDTGFATSDGRLYSVESRGGSYVVHIGDTSRGFVAINTGLTVEEAWRRMYSYLTK